jgi:hypothetical protein
LNSIESSDTVEDGVTVTNTGSNTLTFHGDGEFTLEPGETKTLKTSHKEYNVTCVVNVETKRNAKVQGEVTIATITYPSLDLWKVTEGETVKGAKFSSEVPMMDEQPKETLDTNVPVYG